MVFFFNCYANVDRTFCKQTVETLVRRRILRRLIGVCTICICPTKRMLRLHGLTQAEIPDFKDNIHKDFETHHPD